MGKIVFTNANVLDGEHAAKPDSTVVVEDGRIVKVANGNGSGANGAVQVGPEDRVIDCTGLTLMPGMTQGHYHSTYHNVDANFAYPLGLESPPAYQAYTAQHNVGLALRAGYTSVVGANSAWDVEPSLKQAIAEGIAIGPRIVPGCRELITTADSNDVTPWYWESHAPGGTKMCDGPDEWRKAVREEVKHGSEMIKIFATGGHGVRLSRYMSSITDAEMQAAVEAAHNLGVRVRAHVCSREAVKRCLDAGVDVIDHGEGIDDELIEQMAAQGACYEPSIYSHYVMCGLMGDTNYENEFGQIMKETLAVLPKCIEAGVYVCFGDDFGASIIPHGSYGKEPGFYYEFLKDEGVSELDILKWGTVNGAALVGLPDELGKIEEGYLADIIILNGDPSEDIKLLGDLENVLAVMRDGTIWIDNLPESTRSRAGQEALAGATS